MIVDTSVIVAIALNEPERDHFAQVLALAPRRRMSVAAYLEAALRFDRLDPDGFAPELDAIIALHDIELEPVTAAQARLARDANRRFGKTRHPAARNFGDCFADALAAATGEPLLFKGDDFALTDVARAG